MQPEPLKRVPFPVSFLVAVVVTLALLIFFGAWAVSVDGESRDRALAIALPGGATDFAGIPEKKAEDAPFDPNAYFGGQENTAAADTWWGNALLKACPLH